MTLAKLKRGAGGKLLRGPSGKLSRCCCETSGPCASCPAMPWTVVATFAYPFYIGAFDPTIGPEYNALLYGNYTLTNPGGGCTWYYSSGNLRIEFGGSYHLYVHTVNDLDEVMASAAWRIDDRTCPEYCGTYGLDSSGPAGWAFSSNEMTSPRVAMCGTLPELPERNFVWFADYNCTGGNWYFTVPQPNQNAWIDGNLCWAGAAPIGWTSSSGISELCDIRGIRYSITEGVAIPDLPTETPTCYYTWSVSYDCATQSWGAVTLAGVSTVGAASDWMDYGGTYQCVTTSATAPSQPATPPTCYCDWMCDYDCGTSSWGAPYLMYCYSGWGEMPWQVYGTQASCTVAAGTTPSAPTEPGQC